MCCQSNILVSNHKRALIADFGVSRISVTIATTTNLAINLAFWMAPELLLEEDPAKRKPTKASDIWALACTCFEVSEHESWYVRVSLSYLSRL
jgi:serine/threonine protein kinase